MNNKIKNIFPCTWNYATQSVTDTDMFKIHCIVFSNLWKLTPQHTLWSAVSLCKCRVCSVNPCCVNFWKSSKKRCIWTRDVIVCLSEVVRCYWNIQGSINPWKVHELTQIWSILNFIMEQIKLQCLCSVKQKDSRGTSKTKTKLRNFYI